MKILLVNGSPKGTRSNTWQLTRAFLSGIGAQLGPDAVETRTIVVKDADIRPCLGCFSCWRSEEGTCCLADDMASIIADRVWADVTIWSFPLYYFSVPGPLKNLIDRQLPMALPFMDERTDGVGAGSHPARYDMAGKRNVVVSTCGFYSTEGNYDGVLSLFDHMCGKGNYETVLCSQGELFRVPELHERTDAYLQVVERAGREFAEGGITPDTSRELDQLLYPRETFEAMADASWGISRETGEAEDEALVFTRQMAALYNPASFDGNERVLGMRYTDRDVSCCIVLGPEGSRVVTDGSVAPTTTIDTPYPVWQEIAQGKVSGVDALMQHRYRVSGDFDLMMRWGEFFGGTQGSGTSTSADEAPQAGPSTAAKPSNMLCMLVPWVVFWAAMAMDATRGPAIVLVACALTSLFFYRNERTPYDTISLSCVMVLVAAGLLGAPLQVLLPVSYGAFGLLWLVSSLLHTPLSAYYSKNSYGGDRALRNELFLKTNRIICAAWGVTYMVSALVTLLLVRSNAAPLIALANNVLPLPAALFTVWFQRWYPRHVASDG